MLNFCFRWLNVQCFEMRLPNGKVILTDPQISGPLPEDQPARYFRIPEKYGITKESVEWVDYLILNHSHCDHLIDLGYFVKKFNPMVICHEGIAYELAKTFDIPFTSMYPVGTQKNYEFEDFSLTALNGSHMPQPFVYSSMPNILKDLYGMDGIGTLEMGHLGGLFNLNYMITTRENLRIGFFAGRMDEFNRANVRQMAELRPNVLLRQIPPRLPEKPEEIFAREILEMGVQLMLPMHHECFEIEQPDFLEEVFGGINRLLEEKRFAGRGVIPERGKWYQMQVGICPVEM